MSIRKSERGLTSEERKADTGMELDELQLRQKSLDLQLKSRKGSPN